MSEIRLNNVSEIERVIANARNRANALRLIAVNKISRTALVAVISDLSVIVFLRITLNTIQFALPM